VKVQLIQSLKQRLLEYRNLPVVVIQVQQVVEVLMVAVAEEEAEEEVLPLLQNVLPALISVKYGTHSAIPTKR
jgi:hypothetical protein